MVVVSVVVSIVVSAVKLKCLVLLSPKLLIKINTIIDKLTKRMIATTIFELFVFSILSFFDDITGDSL